MVDSSSHPSTIKFINIEIVSKTELWTFLRNNVFKDKSFKIALAQGGRIAFDVNQKKNDAWE
jgi:hypothetical protein